MEHLPAKPHKAFFGKLRRWQAVTIIAGIVLVSFFLLYLGSRKNYLLFHALAEFWSIAIAVGMFMVAWNSRRFFKNQYFLFIGIGYLFIGALDMMHVFAFRGMGVFPDVPTNLATELWIATRYLEALTLLAAPIFLLNKKVSPTAMLTAFGVVFAGILVSIFYFDIFPDAFIEGQGLTAFKVTSEYVISLFIAGAIGLLYLNRAEFSRDVLRLLVAAGFLTIASEMSFTLYADPYGFFNMLGHYFKIASFYLVYHALVVNGLRDPYQLLFRDLKLSEEAAKRSERNYRTVANFTYDWETWIKPDGAYQYISPSSERVTGFPPQEFLNNDGFMERLVIPEDRAIWLGHREDHGAPVNAKNLNTIQFRIRHKNGDIRWIEHACLPVTDDQGEFLGYRASNRDISGLKALEESLNKINQSLAERSLHLENINQELEAFTYSVSHDLRSPLRSMDGFSQALLEDYGPKLDARGIDYLGRIRAGSLRMGRLIDDLLRLSRITRGELIIEEINLSELACGIADDLAGKTPERRIEFKVQPQLVARADRQLTQIVLANLLANSHKYTQTRPQAEIEIGQTVENGQTAYFVRDNGVGFDMAYADKLFQPFQRLHSEGEFEGTGIGLAIVGRIIKKHGGRIWAESEEGTGATFYFTL